MNEKHLKILKDVCKALNEVITFGDTIRLKVALAAMQVLQDEIDRLEKENLNLKERIPTNNVTHSPKNPLPDK